MLRRTTTWIATLLFLAACGKGVRVAPQDPGQFDKYVVAFEEVAQANGKALHGAAHGVPIHFGSPSKSEAYAECRWDVLAGNEILIDESKWKDLSEDSRRTLLFHELGHCVLNRPHRDGRIELLDTSDKNEKIPTSLMNTTLIDGKVVAKFREYYEKELFENQSQF